MGGSGLQRRAEIDTGMAQVPCQNPMTTLTVDQITAPHQKKIKAHGPYLVKETLLM